MAAVRELIAFECTDPKCKRRNYTSTKNRKKTTEKLSFKKYCPFCRRHTVHRETKIK